MYRNIYNAIPCTKDTMHSMWHGVYVFDFDQRKTKWKSVFAQECRSPSIREGEHTIFKDAELAPSPGEPRKAWLEKCRINLIEYN